MSSLGFKATVRLSNRFLSVKEQRSEIDSFVRTPWAYLIALVAGSLGGPTGIIASPVVLFIANMRGEYVDKNGRTIKPLYIWAAAGIVLTPVLFIINPMLERTFSTASTPSAPVAPRPEPSQLPPVQFGVGDDAAAWLSRCAPPESDTSTAYDDPRPPIVTRFLSYPSKGVRIILTPKDVPLGSPPPYSAWKMVGVTDPSNNQPIEPAEALRRMGASCVRG